MRRGNDGTSQLSERRHCRLRGAGEHRQAQNPARGPDRVLRGLRPAADKSDCVILGGGKACPRIMSSGPWILIVARRAKNTRCDVKLGKTSLLECSQCGAIRIGGKPCMVCGFMPRRPAEYIRIQDGELGLVNGRSMKLPVYDRETKRRRYAEFTSIARKLGKNPGWPYHLYLSKFNEKPDWN